MQAGAGKETIFLKSVFGRTFAIKKKGCLGTPTFFDVFDVCATHNANGWQFFSANFSNNIMSTVAMHLCTYGGFSCREIYTGIEGNIVKGTTDLRDEFC